MTAEELAKSLPKGRKLVILTLANGKVLRLQRPEKVLISRGTMIYGSGYAKGDVAKRMRSVNVEQIVSVRTVPGHLQ